MQKIYASYASVVIVLASDQLKMKGNTNSKLFPCHLIV